jgi:hypothetical protein
MGEEKAYIRISLDDQIEIKLKIGDITNVRKAIALLINIGQEMVQSLDNAPPTDRRIRVLRLSILRAVRIAGLLSYLMNWAT